METPMTHQYSSPQHTPQGLLTGGALWALAAI